ncbi:MAG: GDP-mannose 4,6-dehydratase, partial [Cyclobacteriaceae bacterium]
ISGPYQMGKVDQGVVVLWMARHFWKKDLGYFGYGGEGKQVRDILHVQDLFELVDWQMHHMDQVNGKTFNAGGGVKSSASLQELTSICEEITGNKINFQKVPETRAADLRIYITDNTRITKELDWKPKIGVKQTMTEIYEWIKANEKELKPILY